ncbi:MAG: response regulator [Desulfobacteraceae bacterium]|nr:response regulator [Desulfobacteraceae bacterium]
MLSWIRRRAATVPERINANLFNNIHIKPRKTSMRLLDLTMPHMDGWETLQAIKEIRPDIPVVLASGYDEGHVMDRGHTHQSQAFLHKPYVSADLRAALDSAMTHVYRNEGAS